MQVGGNVDELIPKQQLQPPCQYEANDVAYTQHE
ncbi:hypothetical protein A2U01_0059622, partial [Trifolium medium]|nr:hypothetical protein [Trifolium medium]